MKIKTRFLLVGPLFISGLLHIVILFIVNFLFSSLSEQTLNKEKSTRIVEIEHFLRKNIKTIGKKNGNKSFSIPISPTTISKTPQKLSLNALNASSNKREINKIKKNINKQITNNKTEEMTLPNEEIIKTSLKDSIVRSILLPETTKQTLNHADFNLAFSPPEGVPKDELNSFEKMFFSFQKRTYLSYLSSFIKTYNQLLISKPNLQKELTGNTHRLTGRIIFDNQGNIISIKITKWSQSDEIQQLFEDTLKEIRSVPNPPKAIVQNGQFYIYYQLNIN